MNGLKSQDLDYRKYGTVCMQTYIYKRSRYYLGVMEEDSLKSGQSYSELGDNIVIFICLTDPFDLNLTLIKRSTSSGRIRLAERSI